jgi:hypothetical protein
MPVSTPFDTAQYVTNAARVIVNDAGLSLAGNLLADTQPYTVTLLNMAYRTLQEDLTDAGVETMAKETTIVGITVSGAPTDPGIYAQLSYTGYNNGVANFPTTTLPTDMVGPLRLAERTTGSTQQFVPMFPVNDGLPSCAKQSRLVYWDWRGDAIWLLGALQSNDIRIRYNQFLPELILTGLGSPSSVLILRSDRALAYKIAQIFAEGRGSELAASFKASYEEYLSKITRRTSRRKQRGQHRRMRYHAGSRGGWGY